MAGDAARTLEQSAGWRYRWLTRVATVVFIVHSIYKSLLTQDVRFFKERFGFTQVFDQKFDHSAEQTLHWWHAASVGEIQTAWPLFHLVLQQRLEKDPNAFWLVTTNTTTGCDVLKQRLQQTGLENRVTHAYCPIDTPGITKRFLNRVKPKKVVVVETEIWPNLYTELHNQNIPIAIVNARVTNKTLSTIKAKHRLATTLGPAYKAALSQVHILARSDTDAIGYQSLGASREQIKVVGDLKFADNRPASCSSPLASDDLAKPYVVAASTHHPEEEQLAQQWMDQSDSGLMVIVPRHIERAEKLHKVLTGLYGDAVAQLRSRGGVPNKSHRLYLADTLGELHNWYSGASAAFVGGSLIARGGHNVLEPFFHQLPVVTGPNTINFQDAVRWLNTQNAITEAPNSKTVVQTLIEHRSSGKRIEKKIQSDLLNVYANCLNDMDV